MQKKPAITIGVLCVIALGLGYWVGQSPPPPPATPAQGLNGGIRGGLPVVRTIPTHWPMGWVGRLRLVWK